MKMKKMVGALALTAALAMGTAPAFAATADDNAFSDNGSTEVKAKVDTVNKQVRATVPLQVTVVFAATGGGDITGPTANAYKITNIGEGDIKLTNIELTDLNSIFTSDPIMKDASDYLNASGDEFTSGNHIMFTFKTDKNYNYLTTTHAAKDGKALSADRDILGESVIKWNDETIAKGTNLPIELGGRHWFKDTLDSGEMTDTLCSLRCTIAAA